MTNARFANRRGTANAGTSKEKEMNEKNIDQEEAFPPARTNWPAVVLGFALFGSAMWRLDGWMLLVCVIVSAMLVIAGKTTK